jgi:23S rRNA (guanosine2251-2'-O)-methyltransferase
MKKKSILILDNIRSVYNTGAMFRTCDGVGVSEVFLCGTTPTPIDRFGRKRKDFAKVALGAEESIPWKYFQTTEDAITEAKEQGCEIFALEQDEKSIQYNSIAPTKNFALVVGEETQGLPQNILELSDAVLEIPMRGVKESLNVSVAAGIALYQLLGD